MHPTWPAQKVIKAPEAINLLTNIRSLRILVPFMREPHTLSTAATALGKSPSTVAYWIPRLLRSGLLVHLGDQRRAGIAMPYYRAAAKQLTVAHRDVPFDSRVALLDQGRMLVLRRFLDGLDEAIEKADAFSLGFSAGGDSGAAIEMLETDDHRQQRPYTDSWMTFHLSNADVLEFTHDLEAVVAKYANRTGNRRYISHVGLAPDPKRRWRSFNDPSPL